MQIFKIRNAEGQFSKGGMSGQTKWGWSSQGKSWSGSGPLRRHLAQYLPTCGSSRMTGIPSDWVVVEITLIMQPGEDNKISASATVQEYNAVEFYNKTNI